MDSLARPNRADVGGSGACRDLRDVAPLAERSADAAARPGVLDDPFAQAGGDQGGHIAGCRAIAARAKCRQRLTLLEEVSEGAKDGRGHGLSMIAQVAQGVAPHMCRDHLEAHALVHRWRQIELSVAVETAIRPHSSPGPNRGPIAAPTITR